MSEKMYAIVELLGHQSIAGEISEIELYGSKFIHVEVPPVNGNAGFSRYYSPNAIYCVNPVSEELMTEAATGFSLPAVGVYIPRHTSNLVGYNDSIDYDDDDIQYDELEDYDGGDDDDEDYGYASIDYPAQSDDEEIPF